MKNIIPPHIQYVIKHELACIELRKEQIGSYEERIKLLKKGLKMGEVNSQVETPKSNIKYDVKHYWKLKKQWKK